MQKKKKKSRILTFSSHGMQQFEVVHCHLQNLCFLQLRWTLQGKMKIRSDLMKLGYYLYHWIRFVSSYLFLKSTGYKSAELWQAVVDAVSAPLLYDLQNKRSRGRVRTNPKKTALKKMTIQGYNPLTPLLFFRARICEALPGDMDPVTGL